ncbi:MAG: rRNA maturation RNase YbeY [Hyphomicrobiales bacterium]
MNTKEDIAPLPSESDTLEGEPPQSPPLRLEYVEDGGDWADLAAIEPMLARVAAAIVSTPALQARFAKPVEATLALSSDAAVRVLNARYRQQDKPTNVLSFPAGPVPHIPGETVALGDIMLADGVVRHEAAERAIPLADHIQHLIVHGVLHLLGYDHEAAAEAEIMEDLERQILASLGIDDPYRESQVSGKSDV